MKTNNNYNKIADQLVEQWLDWALQTHPPSPTRCQCDEEAWAPAEARSLYNPETEWPYVTHSPNQCECTNDLRLCKRGSKTVWLCSNCRMSGDEDEDLPVGQETETLEVSVLVYDNGYENSEVLGVFSTRQRAEEIIRDRVNNNDGRGADDYQIQTFYVDEV